MAFLDGTGLGYLLGKIKAAFVSKTDVVAAQAVTIDSTPTANSDNLVKSGGVYSALSGKEATSNKVTSLSSQSTDTQYPSAKCVYDLIGDVETLINAL